MKSFRFLGIAIASLALVGALIGFYAWRKTDTPVVKSEAEIRVEWQRDATEIIQEYPSKKNATQTRDALLVLRVTAADREAHLGLVLALQALINEAPGAEARWQAATAGFTTTP